MLAKTRYLHFIIDITVRTAGRESTTSEFVDFAPESAKQQKISSLHHAGVNEELEQTTTMHTVLYKSLHSVKLSDLCKKTTW